MSELKKEFKNLIDDFEKNIKNKEDLEYVKERTADFMNIVLDHMEKILGYKEDKLSQIEKIQNDLSKKIYSIQKELEDIEQEIHLGEDGMIDDEENETEYDFEIVCPYCDNEFLIDLNQENTEIECPNCNNIIELDWTGDSEEEQNTTSGCESGHCSKCPGCGSNNNEEDDM